MGARMSPHTTSSSLADPNRREWKRQSSLLRTSSSACTDSTQRQQILLCKCIKPCAVRCKEGVDQSTPVHDHLLQQHVLSPFWKVMLLPRFSPSQVSPASVSRVLRSKSRATTPSTQEAEAGGVRGQLGLHSAHCIEGTWSM